VDFLAPAVAGGNAELSIDGAFLFGMSDVVGGSGYFIYCYAGGDIELVPFEAVDDAQAITEFQRRYGPR